MRTGLRRTLLAAVVLATVAVAPAARAQDELSFTIDMATLTADRHTVLVAGTYTCGPLDLDVVNGGGTIDLTVRQGGVSGFGYVPIEVCDGTAVAWQAEVTTFGARPFKRGPAEVDASGIVHGERAGIPVDLRLDLTDQPITISR